jgi:hypothetical protein
MMDKVQRESHDDDDSEDNDSDDNFGAANCANLRKKNPASLFILKQDSEKSAFNYALNLT